LVVAVVAVVAVVVVGIVPVRFLSLLSSRRRGVPNNNGSLRS